MGSRFGTEFGTRLGTTPGTYFPGNSTAAAAPFVGIIDSIVALGQPAPGRALCCFMRLNAAYAGPIFLVENVNTGLTQDIYPLANGDLDTAAIAAFCNGSVGRIHTLYDQSGNARHHTTATATRRPTIYNGASVVTDGVAGRPAAAYSRAALQSLGRAAYQSGAGAYTIFYIGRSSTTSYQSWVTHSPLRFGNNVANILYYIGPGATQRQFTPVAAVTTLSAYISTFAAGTQMQNVPAEQNGTSLAQVSVANPTDVVTFATTDMRNGSESDGAAPSLEGRLPCVMEWGSQLSAPALTLLRDFGADNI